MLSDDVERYIELRRSLGFKLAKTARHLTAFARYAVDRGDTHVRRETATAWTATVSSTPRSLQRRLQEIALFARFRRRRRRRRRAQDGVEGIHSPRLVVARRAR